MSSMPLATACACKRVFTSPGCSKIGEISGQTVTREPLVFQWFLELLWLLCYWVSSYEMTSVDCFKGKKPSEIVDFTTTATNLRSDNHHFDI